MNAHYSPHTGEHIDTDTPAPWMLTAPVAPPPYDKAAASAFWRGEGWEVVAASPAQSAEQIQAEFSGAIQKRLDDFARTRNYDGILSACTYAASAVPKFLAEGQYCVQARDTTWAAAYQILAEVQAGTRPMPTSVADIEADLPALTWPA